MESPTIIIFGRVTVSGNTEPPTSPEEELEDDELLELDDEELLELDEELLELEDELLELDDELELLELEPPELGSGAVAPPHAVTTSDMDAAASQRGKV